GLTGQLRTAFGGNMDAVRAQIQQALSGSGLSAGMQKKIMIEVGANIAQAQAAIASLHGKRVTVNVQQQGAAAVQAAVNSIHGKAITITVTEAFRMTGSPGGVPLTAAGIAANAPSLFTHRQTGGMVPGSGHGDIIPAMLEPGEAVVPRNLVPLVAPILAA